MGGVVLRNRIGGNCAQGRQSPAISLGPVTIPGGVLTAADAVETVEFGTHGVVFALDGRYVPAVMGSGPYILN